MISNYLKIAFRNLFRQKGYSVVNIVGLAVGIAACLVILRYVQFERSFDRFHSKADRIHRVDMIVNGGDDRWAITRRDLGPYLQDAFPDVEVTTRLNARDEPLIKIGEQRFYEPYFRLGEPSFFDVFDVDILQGTASDLARPWTIMLSASTAKKYFGDINPVGAVIEVANKWDQEIEQYEIVGVLQDMPANSHFTIDYLASLASVDIDMNRQLSQTYVLLKEDASIAAFEEKLATLDETNLGWLDDRTALATIPLIDIHLYGKSADSTEVEIQSDIRLVYLFSMIALLIIVLACINYMNLATARAAQRAREVGVRKAIGAETSQLIFQFLGESFLFVLISFLLAVGMAQLSLPVFNNLLQQDFSFDWQEREFLYTVLIGVVVVGFIAGSYPALLLSRFQPARVLKGTVQSHTWPMMRKGLVAFQFAVSIGFIAATLIIYQQLNYVTSEELGFEQDQRLVLMTRGRLGDQAETFKDALQRQAGVHQVALSSGVPGHLSAISFYQHKNFEGATGDPEEHIVFDQLWVDEDFVSTMGLEMVAGRAFSGAMQTDWDQAIMLNETAVETLGIDEPVGKILDREDRQLIIIGVFADFHLHDLKEEMRPMILEMGAHSSYVTLEISTSNLGQSLATLGTLWDQFIPALPFQYAFLEDEIEAMYRQEQRLGRLFALFSGLAVLVACLGLFGLAAYTSIQRTKEIGIRKILGASTSMLIGLLSKDYLKLLAFAFVIVTPFVFFMMNNWLGQFAYRVEMRPWVFMAAGFLTMFIALGTVSYQSIKTSLVNPVEALRYE